MATQEHHHSRSLAGRAGPWLRASVTALAVMLLGGCQLLQLPFQLIGGIVQLAIKLIPIVPLLLYTPTDTPPNPNGPDAQGEEVRLASLERLDRSIQSLRAQGDEAALPAMDARSLERPLGGHRLVGIVFVPAASLQSADSLSPAIAELSAQGYHVEVGNLVDASPLGNDDLLAEARFVRESQRRGVTIVAPAGLDRIETPAEESALAGKLPKGLLALVE